jgi:hypothetical protein
MLYSRPAATRLMPLLVLVRLLIGDPDQLSHLLLGQARHDPSVAHAGPHMPVGILRTSPAVRLEPILVHLDRERAD